MIPGDVLTDARLRARDVRVFGILACCRRGCLASIGQKRLASLACADRRGIRASIKTLTECGHIEAKREGAGRTRFILQSPWFLAQAKAAALPAEAGAGEVRELVKCPKCGKSCRGLLKVGWCRGCNWELKVGRVCERVIEKHEKIA